MYSYLQRLKTTSFLILLHGIFHSFAGSFLLLFFRDEGYSLFSLVFLQLVIYLFMFSFSFFFNSYSLRKSILWGYAVFSLAYASLLYDLCYYYFLVGGGSGVGSGG